MWTAAGWLFDFVVREVAERVESATLPAQLLLIVDEHLGCLSLTDLSFQEQSEIRAVLGPNFLVHADQVLRKDLSHRDDVLRHLATLIEYASDNGHGT